MTQFLDISGLCARIDADGQEKEILKGVDLSIPPGEVHAIMGPNGSGKSTLSYVLAGREDYEVTAGSVTFQGQDLLGMEPEERAAAGLFLAFQSPIELPGVNNANFLRTAVNAVRRARGQDELDAVAFLKTARAAAKDLSMAPDMLKRNVNVGFSGGEKKRNEVLQMTLLEPSFAILDETDSGLDVDALRIVAEGVNRLRSPSFSALVITHHQRLLDYLVPDRIHVMAQGRIIHSGGPELAQQIDREGYTRFLAEAAAA
ncbi:Fe-S cluster assembly ATPase SufC [Acetobacter orleanensis]|uniref:ABC transporter ATP-binding protein n=1 Tax=Acetobacter orleanensis TaxID=104099 RepID=A0A4Y3TPT0_9PROT|nr:Fe-S cluster assembly ATPase SufC [Acetobacter orleanensis]KXV65559.1 cysteine desulfurase [Acetobacter orleanensis]PCD79100.1 Fe-S cluster assembly ATPase SufC [Acetobacter orleanensis]GAN67692.1 ABC transporter FeS assembly ATPase SufC [Acetobacter orleanensis JCM 7639]GBR22276.1 FeS assembly ATP-binding protein SufC [Acetobacter orleanensis NRIC 0473]GEB83030.1 ABC transporter ATP-binding protein [Acetobacter orleanensis]